MWHPRAWRKDWSQPPDKSNLRGILHAAAVLDDSLVFSMTKESVERVWAPKVTGALRMHQASVGCELDWWLGFSSVASLLGGPGRRHTRARAPGSTRWSRGAGHRVCLRR